MKAVFETQKIWNKHYDTFLKSGCSDERRDSIYVDLFDVTIKEIPKDSVQVAVANEIYENGI
jgi:hypothetical protein